MKTFDSYAQQVHDGIDAKDPETLEQYAEHCADNFDSDHLYDLALAIVSGDDAGKALALLKIEGRIDRQRAEFIEMEAQRRVRLVESMEDAA